MGDAIIAGVEIGAVILAAAVLIGHFFVRKERTTEPRTCYFDRPVLVGDREITDEECIGIPGRYRYVYLARGETGINVRELDVCVGHIAACEKFVDALQHTVKAAEVDR